MRAGLKGFLVARLAANHVIRRCVGRSRAPCHFAYGADSTRPMLFDNAPASSTHYIYSSVLIEALGGIGDPQ